MAAHRIPLRDRGARRTAPAYVLVNGLTQYAELWAAYREALVARNFRVATFDLLGQGESDKPRLFITQDDQVAALGLLIDELGDAPVFLCGISFGGLIALRYAISHGDRLAGLVPMSCFAELSPQLHADRQCPAHRPDPRRHRLPAGHAAADEPVQQLAEAAARQSRQREAAGLAGQRRLRPAEPDGVLPRLRAPDAATVVDPACRR